MGTLSLSQQGAFFHRLGTALGAGLTIPHAIGLACGNEPRSSLGKLGERLQSRLKTGQTLAEALAAENPTPFSPWVLALVRLGEESGALHHLCPQIAQRLVTQGQRQRHLRSAGSSLMMTLGGATILPGLLWGWPWLLMAVNLAIVLGVAWGFLVSPTCQPLRNQSPVFQRLSQTQAMVQLSQLALPLACGLSLAAALELLLPYVEDPTLKAIVRQAIPRIHQGHNLTDSLRGRIPSQALEYIRTGEESGTLDEMLSYMGVMYGEQFELHLNRSIGILRPLGLLGAGSIVLGLGLTLLRQLLATLPG